MEELKRRKLLKEERFKYLKTQVNKTGIMGMKKRPEFKLRSLTSNSDKKQQQ